MRIPTATYRLQFSSQFTFHDALLIIEYLAWLGISDIYASPILKSKKNSQHGYDVIDPTQIDPQIGGKEAFDKAITKAKQHELGWLQDIVPNHMAFDSDNRPLMDILEKGRRSMYYAFFDIQWDHPYEHLRGKLLCPFLGDLYGKCLDRNEITLHLDESGFYFRYGAWRFPLKIASYTRVLVEGLNWLEANMNHEDRDYIQFLEVVHHFKDVDDIQDTSAYYNQLALAKARLWQAYVSHPTIKTYIDSLLAVFNGSPQDPHSLNKLDALLSEQYFVLSLWKVGNEELNYRRFFNINGLLSVRVEDQAVFDYMHNFIFQLVTAGQITGLRIDHVDGLYEPIAYLNKIRQRQKELYITLEKILEGQEHLPSCMNVQGTTGYDFMNVINGIFIDKSNEKTIDNIYVNFTGQEKYFRDLVSENKKFFMGQQMAGDIDNLAHWLKQIGKDDRYAKDMTLYALRRTIVEIMSHFPVYRSYMGEVDLSQRDTLNIKEAIIMAKNKIPALINELDFIAKILLLDFAADVGPKTKEAYYHFTKKFQQYSGALMAKAAEDTTFYIYNRFISLNEVGSDPSIFGLTLKDFHEFMIERQSNWPSTMNASSTHDTKRGEDVRARLNVLSEIPNEWEKQVRAWGQINADKKKVVQQAPCPDANEEYFIYQTLIGAWPFEIEEQKDFVGRLQDTMVKAMREARVHTAWNKQDAEYESGCTDFIQKILEDDQFLDLFLPFHKTIASDGIINSLAQLLIKMTAPGFPDFYQGSELWNLSLVDPDNRRPVDYKGRMKLLNEITGGSLQGLWDKRHDGRVKLWLMHKILSLRKQNAELFLQGEYLPLEVSGALNKYVLAFARRRGPHWAITVTPRFLRQFNDKNLEWGNVFLTLPSGAPSEWVNVISGQPLHINEAGLSLQKLFKNFPLVLLLSV